MELKVGDHIYIHRYSPIYYTHHGIVVSIRNNKSILVAHPVKFKEYVKFMITDLKEFIGDLSYCVPVDVTDYSYHDTIKSVLSNPLGLVQVKEYERRLHPIQIARNAINFVRSNQKYCILTNNCEMFAEYCVTGIMQPVSRQFINNVKKYITGNNIVSNINIFIVDQILNLIS